MTLDRRQFIASLAGAGTASILLPRSGFAGAGDGWSTVYPEILRAINAPKFPKRDFRITDYGAKADASYDSTAAIAAAIAACTKAGGGRVVVPAGQFSTGAIHLKSNVDLHLASGATLKFSSDAKKYP